MWPEPEAHGTGGVDRARVGSAWGGARPACYPRRRRWPLDFARVLDRVAPLLDEGGFPYALVGGLGLHAYGSSRATFDPTTPVDVLALRRLKHSRRLSTEDSLRALGRLPELPLGTRRSRKRVYGGEPFRLSD